MSKVINVLPDRFNGVHVNIPAIKARGYKSLDELKAEKDGIFEHLNDADKADAYAKLWANVAPAAGTSAKALPAAEPLK